MQLTHHDNGKCKYDSHTISIQDDYAFIINPNELISHNITDVYGYGETKEEALKDFLRKMNILFDEYKAIENLLFGTDIYTSNIKEVDCFGNEIK